ncbi:hypothetical protein [Ancylobacter sp.]|uniref:hypothetical protein n=1 Tax=Ancylobacter sp. TaxID=1872567 RepID=UPI003BAA6899
MYLGTGLGILIVAALVLSVAGYHFYVAFGGFAAGDFANLTVLPKLSGEVRPEPAERFVFLSVSVAIGVLALLVAAVPPRFPSWMRPTSAALANFAIYFCLSALVLLGLSRFDFGPSLLYGEAALQEGGARRLAVIWLSAVAVLAVAHLLPRRFVLSPSTGAWLAGGLFAGALVLQIVAWRLVGEEAVKPNVAWSIHWDAMVYAIAQVSAGKTLLVDLPSQYGLYPEFLGRIFRVTDFSVLKLSLLFAAMQVASMVAVYWVVLRLTRSVVFRVTFGLAFVLVTFETVLKINGITEFYFQYWPIRFFWPALSVLAVYAYAHRPDLSRAAMVSFCAAVGTVWNADTGVMVIGAFAALLAAKAILRPAAPGGVVGRTFHEIQALLLLLTVLSVTLAGTFAYFTTVTPEAPHWEWLMTYPNLFYRLGLNMLPLPLGVATPWMSVLGVYLLGLLFALSEWRRGARAPCVDVVFYLSALGWGLFVYYQGRSHILNLVTVCWPALAIATILADRTVRMVRAGGLGPVHLALPALALTVLMFCALPFVQNIGPLWRDAERALDGQGRLASPLVADELDFIRRHTRPGDECVILAQRQGLYYASARLRSPLKGPGYVEMLTVEDRDAMLRQLASGKFGCVFVGEGGDTALKLNTDVWASLRHYGVVDTNTSKSMSLLGLRGHGSSAGPISTDDP